MRLARLVLQADWQQNQSIPGSKEAVGRHDERSTESLEDCTEHLLAKLIQGWRRHGAFHIREKPWPAVVSGQMAEHQDFISLHTGWDVTAWERTAVDRRKPIRRFSGCILRRIRWTTRAPEDLGAGSFLPPRTDGLRTDAALK